MRFIVREQGYETPIMAGKYRYEKAGQPTGAIETWRLTQATPGYQVLRVDLDGRLSSGHTSLFHLVQQENGQPERLNYRFWNDDFTIEGTLIFSDSDISGRRTVNGQTIEENIATNAETPFWFPSTVGLGKLVQQINGDQLITTATLDSQPATTTTLQLRSVALKSESGTATAVSFGNQTRTAVAWQLSWNGGWRKVTIDQQTNWPLSMKRDDGLTAVATQLIQYGSSA